MIMIITSWKYFSDFNWNLDCSQVFQTFEKCFQKWWVYKFFSLSHVLTDNFCRYKKNCPYNYDVTYTAILLLYLIWTNKLVTYLSFVTYIWVIGRLRIWDKMGALFRNLSCLIKIKRDIGLILEGVFCHIWCCYRTVFGSKNCAWIIVIQAVLLLSKISAVPITNDHLKLTRSEHHLLTNTHSCVGLMQ